MRPAALLAPVLLALAAPAACAAGTSEDAAPAPPAALPDGATTPPVAPAMGDASAGADADSGARFDPCRGAPLPEEVHYVPPGFCARSVASGISYVRQLTFAPNGDLFATNYLGRVWLLRDDDGDGVFSKAEVHD